MEALNKTSDCIYNNEVETLKIKQHLRHLESEKSLLDNEHEKEMLTNKTLTNETHRKVFIKTKQNEDKKYQDLVSEIEKFSDELFLMQSQNRKYLREYQMEKLSLSLSRMQE